MPPSGSEEQILVVAPIGHDASAIADMLRDQGISALPEADLSKCAALVRKGMGALLMTEEALELPHSSDLIGSLRNQPPWSELPVIVLTSGGETRMASLLDLAASSAGALTLLERPMTGATLLRSVQVALQTRRRQYQARDLLAELQQSEQRYRLLFDRNPDGVFMVNVDGRFTMANPACAKISGYSRDELLTKSFLDICAPDRCAATLANFQTDVATARYSEFETALIRKDGVRVEVWIAGEPIQAEGKVVAVHCTAKDITARKQVEQELRQANAILSAINKNTPALVAMKDLQGRVTFCNPAVLQLTGLSLEKAIGRNDIELYGEETGSLIMAHDRRVLGTGKTETFQESANGRVFNITKTPRFDDAGQIAGLIVVGTDITELAQAQQSLAEQERRLTLAMQAGKLVPWEMNLDTGEVKEFSGLLRLFGLDPASPHGAWRELIMEDGLKAIYQSFESAKCGREYHVEYRIRHPSGSIHWHEGHGTPVADEQGRYTRLIGYVRDITPLKEFQSELERLVAERTARLQELVNELEHFSYSITHDMRAPLRSMAGFVEMALELCGTSDVDQQINLLRRIGQSAARMDALITDALSYSEAVRKHLPLAPVDPNQLLRGMLDSYPELQAARARIQISADIPRVYANEAGLTQCFSNLLNNAIKFSKPGQTPLIRIWAQRTESASRPQTDPKVGPKPFHPAGFEPVPPLPAPVFEDGQPTHWIRIWVEDEGLGIAEIMQPRIFNMFTRGRTGSTGNGIGLALVRKVVDRMGGRIGVESKEGVGSRFWIELMPA